MLASTSCCPSCGRSLVRPATAGWTQQATKAVGTTVVAKRRTHGGDEQGQSRDALLSINEHDAVTVVRVDRREDRTDEVRALRNASGPDIGEQPTAAFHVPPVMSL